MMAKFSNKNTFTNATIDLKDNVIIEYTKEDTKVYNLRKILEQWDGVEGISLTIAKTAEITPDK